MWRSSTEAPRPRRGFTLIEAMVSLLLLVVVLTVAMTMLFQMRAFAERQQFYMLPRQAARRAADYLSFYVASASDLNQNALPQNPNALVMYYNLGGKTLQASYDNLTGAESKNSVTTPGVTTAFGDLGTDVITLVAPVNPAKYRVTGAPSGFPGFGAGKDIYVGFRNGCGGPSGTDDATNLAQFKAATGFDGTNSALLMFCDKDGSWTYFQIPAAGYKLKPNGCKDLLTLQNIHIKADTLDAANLVQPPGGNVGALSDPVYLVTGLQFISFRVRTDSADNIPKLQQKIGLFDPNKDKPGADFVNVMENVEDLQIAYVYQNGDIWNNTKNRTISNANAGTACNTPPCNNHVPTQAGPAAVLADQLDVSGVIGLRFSITARSPLLSLASQKLTNVNSTDSLATTTSLHFRPLSENHAVTMVTATKPLYDLFDHYRATTTLLLRNRTLGN